MQCQFDTRLKQQWVLQSPCMCEQIFWTALVVKSLHTKINGTSWDKITNKINKRKNNHILQPLNISNYRSISLISVNFKELEIHYLCILKKSQPHLLLVEGWTDSGHTTPNQNTEEKQVTDVQRGDTGWLGVSLFYWYVPHQGHSSPCTIPSNPVTEIERQ